MNRNAMQKLRLDRRLLSRRDWISASELEREIESLPDAAHKATTLGEATGDEPGPARSDAAGEPHPAD